MLTAVILQAAAAVADYAAVAKLGAAVGAGLAAIGAGLGIGKIGGGAMDLRDNNMVRVSRAMRDTAYRALAVRERLMLKNSKEPTAEEIAKELNMPTDKVREIMKIAQEPVSLETPIGEEEDSHLGDFLEDENAAAPSDSVAFTMLKEQLLGVLDTLTPREEKVLRLRYGIDDGRPRTLEEVGKEFNVTRERIRQIEAKALRKLRHPSRSKRLKDFLE